jgi:hypothetical protein
MLWNYDCPECHKPTSVDWTQREAEAVCRRCARVHYPPTPHEDHYGYVDDAKWPPEMEEAVLSVRGAICAVPGCYGEHTTLVLRQPASSGGRTSVDNLRPVCERHAASKGNRPWDEWMAEVSKEQDIQKQAAPKFEVTITTHEPKPEPPVAEFSAPPAGLMLPLAALRAPRPLRTAVPGAQPLADMKLAVPFMRGPAGKITFSYDWEMKKSGRCRLFLLAWPRSDEPDITLLGGPKYVGFQVGKDHLGVKDDKGNAELELTLPASPGGRWTAAVAVLDLGCDFQLIEYALAATR